MRQEDSDKSGAYPVAGVRKPHSQEISDQLWRRLSEIGRQKVKLTFAAVLFNGALFGAVLALCGFDFDRARAAFSNVFLYQIVGWTTWFIYPYFLRMEAKSDMGLAMSRDSVDILSSVDAEFEGRLARIDAVLGALERQIKSLEEGRHPVLDRIETSFKQQMELLRTEVSQARGRAEAELEEALASGEAEAARLEEAAETPPAPGS